MKTIIFSFDTVEFAKALADYSLRERRFGLRDAPELLSSDGSNA